MLRNRLQLGFSYFCKDLVKDSDNILPVLGESQSFVRLSKWMSMKSICSRREAEEIIGLGLVRIDGKRVYQNMMVPLSADMKAFTPIGLHTEKPTTRLWLMNKPRGYICSHNDPQKRQTVYQILPPEFKTFGHIMSVGRLDFNSEGLLLLTNDTILKNLLENPQANLERFYRVKVHGRVTPEKIEKMSSPMEIKGIPYGPLRVSVDRSLSTNVWLNVGLRTGKNREIRRILQKCDLQVNKLIRQSYGPYKLGSLKHGQLKELPISPGLERKIKIEKAQRLSSLPKCLIEVDIREKALEIAQNQKMKLSNASSSDSKITGNEQTKNPSLPREI